MKKVIFGLLSIVSIAFISCEKQDIPNATDAGATEASSAKLVAGIVVTANQLNGIYQLKDGNTASNKTWVSLQNVGLNFLPNTFYYSVNKLTFSSSTGKVALSTVISGYPEIKSSTLPYSVAGEILKITVSGNAQSSGSYKVVSISNNLLVLEDTRTKAGWRFVKK
jgi:hypothetical protein